MDRNMFLSDQELYDEWLDCLVIKAANKGATSFRSLVLSLPSVYPSVVLRAVQRLTASGIIPQQVGASCIREATHKQLDALPSLDNVTRYVPHPLDYEWRFRRQTVGKLLSACLQLSSPGSTIVILGVPSLIREIGLRKQSDRNFIFCDSNKTVFKMLAEEAPRAHLIHWNAAHNDLPPLSAQCVVVDAPWYPEYIASFLWAAGCVCAPGGHILVSLPPLGTRPGMLDERQRLLAWAQKASLRLVEWKTSTLTYESPYFEKNALNAEGITNYPAYWRKGDLAVFTSDGGTSVTPRPTIKMEESQWEEYVLQSVRIRVKQHRGEQFAAPKLVSLIAGDVLPSVSRRDVRRTQATVWTSGNRVFRCDVCSIMGIILRALASEQSPLPHVEQIIDRRLTQAEYAQMETTLTKIKEIVRLERSEMERYGT